LKRVLRRLEQAGGKPTSWVQLICELQRDWKSQIDSGWLLPKILFAIEGH